MINDGFYFQMCCQLPVYDFWSYLRVIKHHKKMKTKTNTPSSSPPGSSTLSKRLPFSMKSRAGDLRPERKMLPKSYKKMFICVKNYQIVENRLRENIF